MSDHLEITYAWLVRVLQRQQKWLDNDTLYSAFPYKTNVTRIEFDTVIKHMKAAQSDDLSKKSN